MYVDKYMWPKKFCYYSTIKGLAKFLALHSEHYLANLSHIYNSHLQHILVNNDKCSSKVNLARNYALNFKNFKNGDYHSPDFKTLHAPYSVILIIHRCKQKKAVTSNYHNGA